MYILTLTQDDVDAIGFVGDRYAWAEALRAMEPGENRVAEHEAWEIAEAFEADTEGGHSPFPLLGPSELRDKLQAFWDAII